MAAVLMRTADAVHADAVIQLLGMTSTGLYVTPGVPIFPPDITGTFAGNNRHACSCQDNRNVLSCQGFLRWAWPTAKVRHEANRLKVGIFGPAHWLCLQRISCGYSRSFEEFQSPSAERFFYFGIYKIVIN